MRQLKFFQYHQTPEAGSLEANIRKWLVQCITSLQNPCRFLKRKTYRTKTFNSVAPYNNPSFTLRRIEGFPGANMRKIMIGHVSKSFDAFDMDNSQENCIAHDNTIQISCQQCSLHDTNVRIIGNCLFIDHKLLVVKNK